MWADTLLAAERAHLLRLFLWAGGSIVVGTALLLLLAMRRGRSPLLEHFGIQMLAWGSLDLALVTLAWRDLALRDVSGATRLDRLLWLNTGLNVGYIAAGATLAITGWLLGRRLGVVGAGIGVVVQGTALFALDLALLSFTTHIV